APSSTATTPAPGCSPRTCPGTAAGSSAGSDPIGGQRRRDTTRVRWGGPGGPFPRPQDGRGGRGARPAPDPPARPGPGVHELPRVTSPLTVSRFSRLTGGCGAPPSSTPSGPTL